MTDQKTGSTFLKLQPGCPRDAETLCCDGRRWPIAGVGWLRKTIEVSGYARDVGRWVRIEGPDGVTTAQVVAVAYAPASSGWGTHPFAWESTVRVCRVWTEARQWFAELNARLAGPGTLEGRDGEPIPYVLTPAAERVVCTARPLDTSDVYAVHG